MKIFWVSSWILVSLFILSPVLRAEESNSEVTKEDLDGVRNEVATLRDQWQRTLDKKTAVTTRSLTLGGIIQTRYTEIEDKNAIDGFDISTIILNFNGNLWRDYEEGRNLNYSLSFITGGTAQSEFNRIRPLEASINYFILPSLDLETPLLSIIFGQQKKPFGLEALGTEEKKPTIKSAQSASKLGLDPRDIGIVIKGDLFPVVDYGFKYRVPIIEYSLGLVNGSGPNVSDENNKKDWAARYDNGQITLVNFWIMA